MEKEKTERIRESVLAGFVLISVILISLLWVNAYLDRGADGPGFYRATISVASDYWATRTAEAALDTEVPTREHKKETPMVPSSPTVIPPVPSEGVDQVN